MYAEIIKRCKYDQNQSHENFIIKKHLDTVENEQNGRQQISYQTISPPLPTKFPASEPMGSIV